MHVCDARLLTWPAPSSQDFSLVRFYGDKSKADAVYA